MASEKADIIEPVEQRLVTLTPAGDDEVLAARTATADIYLPLPPLCAALGINWATQFRKIKNDEEHFERTRQLRLRTRGGPQVQACMEIEAIPQWLASIEPSRVRADLRERLKAYKRWVRKVVYDAFARETGLAAAASTAVTPTPSADVVALEQIERMGLAIATLARQQIAYEQHTDLRLASLESSLVAHQEAVMGRLDQAATVVGVWWATCCVASIPLRAWSRAGRSLAMPRPLRSTHW